MKILCDQMLGSLASWLRFMGVDTFYTTDRISDDEILQKAIHEQRTLITGDKELIIRARKQNIPIIPVTTSDLDDQIRLVISMIPVEMEKILTRCSLCNALLDSIEKQLIAEQVPLKVYQRQSEFWKCPTCARIYWKGSHYDRIVEKIESCLS